MSQNLFMRVLLNICGTALLCGATSALAAGPTSDLEQQLNALKAQNSKLNERIKQVEQKLEGQEAMLAEERKLHMHQLGQQTVQERPDAEGEPAVPVKLSGLVEVETSLLDDYAGTTSSDIVLATVELGVDAEVSEWAQAHILFLWEEGEGPVDVDEATITLGNTEKFPLYLAAGKMFVPFGRYDTYMIQDTLTHELGEIGDSALLAGFEAKGFAASLYAFNGEVNEAGVDDGIKSFGASVGYGVEGERGSFAIGVDLVNDLADSEVVAEALGTTGEVVEYVGGLAAHLSLAYGPLSMMAEYVGATDSFTLGDLDFNGQGAKPQAWNIEAGYTSTLFGRKTVYAVGYQGTDEALALELPAARYLAAISVHIADNTSLSVEYLHDKDYDASEGGTGESADQGTMRLALEF